MKSNFLKVALASALVVSSLGLTSCNKSEMQVRDTKHVEADGFTMVAGLDNGQLIPNKFIVKYKDNSGLRLNGNLTFDERLEVVAGFTNDLLQEMGIPSTAVERTYGTVLKGFVAELTQEQVERLKKDSRIEYIEQDKIVSLGGKGKPGSGGGTDPAQETPWGITRVGGAQNGVGKTAWVIDTGIDLDHADLNVDSGRSRSFLDGRDAKSADDGNGHGTHVAGTIAAINNNFGVVGVAAGATVVAVRVLDSRGSGSNSGVIAGVDYVGAVAGSSDVANMSLGGGASQALDDAVKAASNRCKFVLAAGNESQFAGNVSPARVNGANIYTISAFDVNDRFASFSNYGNPPVDYAAPGVAIKSTWKGGGYNTISGTSMASPHAAGVLLMRSTPTTSGRVTNDPDGNADNIIHL